jgi:O-antigen/teichoic acid export membrane protein
MVLSAAALWLGYSVVALAFVFLFQNAAVRLVLAWLLRRRHAWLFETPAYFRKALLRRMAALALPMFLTQLGSLFVFQINPVLIVSALGVAALPDYSALLVLAMYGGQIAMAIPQTLMPFAAAKKAAGDDGAIRRLLVLALKSCMALSLLYAVCLLAFGDTLMGLWIGSGHFLGFPILAVMLVMYSLEYHHQAHAQFAWGVGRWPYAKAALIAGGLNVVLVWWGLRHGGLLGAALGTAVAQLLTNNWYVPWTVLGMLKISPGDYARKVAAPLLGLALLLAAAAWLGRAGLSLNLAGQVRGVPVAEAARAALVIAALALLGLVAAWKALLSATERETFRSALARARKAA